jgi:hypothetical protein
MKTTPQSVQSSTPPTLPTPTQCHASPVQNTPPPILFIAIVLNSPLPIQKNFKNKIALVFYANGHHYFGAYVAVLTTLHLLYTMYTRHTLPGSYSKS